MIAIRRYDANDLMHTVTAFADHAVGEGPMVNALAGGRLVAIFAFDGIGGRIEIGANA